MRAPLLCLLLLLTAACGPAPSAPSTPSDAPPPAPPAPAAPEDDEDDEDGPAVTVVKPVWKDAQGQPIATPTPRQAKRWNGLVTGNWKDPLPGVAPDERCVVLHSLVGSPAALSGLKEMDVIVSSEGKPVKNYKDYLDGARTVEIGETLDLEVMRSGERLSISMAMVEKPDDLIAWRKEKFPGSPQHAWEVPLMRPAGGGTASSAAAVSGGQYQVLYFWATWCGPCRRTSPILSTLHDELGGKGVQIVGVSSEEQPVIADFIAKNATYTYPVGWDADGSVKRDYEVKKLPTIVLIDKDGTVMDWDISVSGVNRIVTRVRSLLAGG